MIKNGKITPAKKLGCVSLFLKEDLIEKKLELIELRKKHMPYKYNQTGQSEVMNGYYFNTRLNAVYQVEGNIVIDEIVGQKYSLSENFDVNDLVRITKGSYEKIVQLLTEYYESALVDTEKIIDCSLNEKYQTIAVYKFYQRNIEEATVQKLFPEKYDEKPR